ncbi:MFS transporter [Marinactinospora rubrisoli]|uniref:MFS transporter n=1 Tax=Marinactinospora rubrisoli TaxID=2715399 RepID=A0ABW2KLM2_9ACTN
MESSPISRARAWATLAIACLAALLLALDLTVLHLAVPALTADLRPSATQLLWIADIYGFALGGLLVTMGNVGDRIGRKRLLLAGTSLFGVASVVTAYAPTAEALIAARALLGVAGATVMPSTLSIIRDAFTDPQERTAAVGIWSGASAAGFALGPVLGGVLLDHFWWGSVFLVNVPVVVLVVAAGAFVLPESRNPAPGRLDLLSVPLSIAGVIGVIYAVKEAAHGAPGPDAAAALVVGVTSLVVFVRRQTRLAEPLIDVRLFRRRAFAGSIGCAVVAMFANLAMSLLMAQYFQLVLGWSPLHAGLMSLPGALAGVVGGMAAAPLIASWGRARAVAVGLGLCTAGFLLYSRLGAQPDYLLLIPALLVFGMGTGLAFSVTNDTVLAVAPRKRAGAAAAISETGMEVGGALGIAVLGSVLNSAYRGTVRLPEDMPEETRRAAEDSLAAALDAAASLPPEPARAAATAAREAFLAGIGTTMTVAAVLLAVIALTALFALRGVPRVIPDEHLEPSAPGADGRTPPAAQDGEQASTAGDTPRPAHERPKPPTTSFEH